jgi:hypothetical protein
MVNTSLLFLLLIPVVLSLISYPILTRRMGTGPAIVFSLCGVLVASLILFGAVALGKGYKMADTEVWSGEITSKERIHDTYEQSYQCHCTTDSKGNTSCQTCYETHYTVQWYAHSNIRTFQIDKLDRTTRLVYMSPDPAFYTGIQKGDPVAMPHQYTNYIKAVPESILRPMPSDLKKKYVGMIPNYPLQVHDFYSIDRVVPVGVNIPNLREWNDALAQKLKTLGPTFQANVVLVVTNIADPNYFYALQDAWLNGKKNDIVVVIGAPKFPAKAEWVNIMALTKTDLFQVQLRDSLLDFDSLTAGNIIDTIDKQVRTNFKRRSMKEFQYLEAEIDPPTWVIVSSVVVVILSFLGFWVYSIKMSKRNAWR